MENILLKYFSLRYEEEARKSRHSGGAGPVITVSREFGCPAKEFSNELITRLNQADPVWQLLSKEVLDEAAKELQMEPKQLEYVFKGEKRSTIDEIINAMSSRYYHNDRRIRKTVKNVVRKLAERGHVIILGRCGVCIADDIRASIHLKLEAPVEYRLENVMKWQMLSREQALEMMDKMDASRRRLRDDFSGGEFDPHRFDLRINMQTFYVQQAVNLAMEAVNTQNLV